MKKSQLKEIIREETKKIIDEKILTIKESSNNQTSKPKGLPKGKSAFLKDGGIAKTSIFWREWEKGLKEMMEIQL